MLQRLVGLVTGGSAVGMSHPPNSELVKVLDETDEEAAAGDSEPRVKVASDLAARLAGRCG
jgi:hypothetical protein